MDLVTNKKFPIGFLENDTVLTGAQCLKEILYSMIITSCATLNIMILMWKQFILINTKSIEFQHMTEV